MRLWLSPHRPGRCHLPRPPNTATTVVRFCTSAIEIVIGTEIAIGMADAIEATPIGIDHIIDPTVTISPMAILTISPTAIMGTPTITAGQASASSSDSKWGHTGFMDGISAGKSAGGWLAATGKQCG